jgi:hypothetical protein
LAGGQQDEGHQCDGDGSLNDTATLLDHDAILKNLERALAVLPQAAMGKTTYIVLKSGCGMIGKIALSAEGIMICRPDWHEKVWQKEDLFLAFYCLYVSYYNYFSLARVL